MTVLVVAHTGRPEAVAAARTAVETLVARGVEVRVLAPDAAAIGCPGAEQAGGDRAAAGADLVLVLGGDGTLLRAAELARPHGAALLGVNLGHVGFLAESEQADLADTLERVAAKEYVVESRMTVGYELSVEGAVVERGWALNEVSLEKGSRERMLEVVAEVDGRPLSRWGCDGVVCATPTGSTAYAFSAGGPVVWPDLEALLLVPISAHALFARPLVVGPDCVLAFEVLPAGPPAALWADGRRGRDVPPGARLEVRRGELPVRLARLGGSAFTDRLVRKFELPVRGWRGRVPLGSLGGAGEAGGSGEPGSSAGGGEPS